MVSFIWKPHPFFPLKATSPSSKFNLKGTWEYGHAAKAFVFLALTLAFSNIIVFL
jgi:hypothetical protein